MTARKSPEQRVGRRRYAGENGYKAAKPVVPTKRRRAPACSFPSLGPAVWQSIADHLHVPDGPHAGRPLVLNADQTEVLYQWYRLNKRGAFVYRRGCWRAAQGTGKSPLLAAMALAELAGPTRFGGWDAKGRPLAVAPVAPWIQIAAVSEDQSGNTYKAARLMAVDSDLADTVLDVGLTRVVLKAGAGLLEAVTASASTRFGQRVSRGDGRDAPMAQAQRWATAGRRRAPFGGEDGRPYVRVDQRLRGRRGARSLSGHTSRTKAPRDCFTSPWKARR